MAVTFEEAPNVQELGNKILQKYHGHLVEARIRFLFRSGTWSKAGKEVYGDVKKVSGMNSFLSELDFVVLVNQELWPSLTHESKVALLDHLLTHCSRGLDDKEGNPRWTTRGHDVEEFSSIAKRHGNWTADLELFTQGMEERIKVDSEKDIVASDEEQPSLFK